jgi:4-hydroxy-2-oxoheptanedioate aldolase
MLENQTRQKLLAGEPAFGAMFNIPEPALVELCAYAGFDFVFIDMEHGAINIETLADMTRAANALDLNTVARVPRNAPDVICGTLDAGAQGIVVPGVTTGEDAQRAVQHTRYSPLGNRGVGSGRARGYGYLLPVKEYAAEMNEQVLLVALLENIGVLDNLDSILKVAGIDVFLVGPSDLSQSMGLIGEFDHARFREAQSAIIDSVIRSGRIMGSRIRSAEEGRQKLAQGFRWLHVSVNDIIVKTGKQLIEDIRSTP